MVDLMICDEAHRTQPKFIGKTEDSKEENKTFSQVHYNMHPRLRLFMTATPVWQGVKNMSIEINHQYLFGEEFCLSLWGRD